MKKLSISLIMLLTGISTASSQEMKFERMKVDYGIQEKGSDPLRLFKFTNTGTSALVIIGAKGSCGCTVPKWPAEPIMPGESSEIEVRYDTNRVGSFNKNIKLTTNDIKNKTTILSIEGTITEEKRALPEKEKNVFE
jgi:hypothetical protein